jgi:hypothetical protein
MTGDKSSKRNFSRHPNLTFLASVRRFRIDQELEGKEKIQQERYFPLDLYGIAVHLT